MLLVYWHISCSTSGRCVTNVLYVTLPPAKSSTTGTLGHKRIMPSGMYPSDLQNIRVLHVYNESIHTCGKMVRTAVESAVLSTISSERCRQHPMYEKRWVKCPMGCICRTANIMARSCITYKQQILVLRRLCKPKKKGTSKSNRQNFGCMIVMCCWQRRTKALALWPCYMTINSNPASACLPLSNFLGCNMHALS